MLRKPCVKDSKKRSHESYHVVFLFEGNHRIQRWINGASVGSTIAGNGIAGASSSQLNHPYGITFDMLNNFYVADSDNNRIQRFNLTHS
jgi:hypothetical protein